MVENKKIKSRLILKVGISLLVISAFIAGIFLLINYIPSVKEVFILATTRKPETFTELYFEDHLSLPKEIILFKENNFKFTVHNLENKEMEYPYEVYLDANGEKKLIDKSSVLIKNNEYKTITKTFIITTELQRAKIVVNLIGRDQQIHFWMGEE